ncbi:MAG: hypothetical protein ABIP89_13105 [Polyangiaceae bacterium]
MRARWVLGISTILAACGTDDTVRVSVAPTLLFPHALLDNVTKLTITVYEAKDGAMCDANASAAGNISKPITTKDLTSGSCSGGGKFCGDLQVVESPDMRVFGAAGFSKSGEQVAVGCGTAKVNQDALPLSITMKRFVKPAVCGNGTVEPTEQCEPGGSSTDPLCDDMCHTKEVLLSNGDNSLTSNGKPGDKQRPVFLWPAQSGAAGKFLAFFGDKSPPSFTHVTMRVLSDSFQPFTGQGSAVQTASFFLPNNSTGSFPPAAEANSQFSPTAATVGAKYYVAYEDDGAGSVDIRLRSMDGILTPEQGPAGAIGINGGGGAGEAGVQSLPSMAASSNGLLFIAWQDATGIIRGRTYDPAGGTLGTQRDVSTGASNKRPVITSNGTGWVAVWESGADVKVRAIGADGTPIGAEQKVNDSSHSGNQSHPSVAGLADGRFAVTWAGNSDIFAQRFGANTMPIAGDQGAKLNNVVVDGDQNSPVIAASTAVGGSFVVAWTDGASGHIRARLLGGDSGFLFNNVDAQNGEFQASVDDGRTRANPTAVVGGAGAAIAIGWEDNTTDARSGVYGRRFPLPSQ